MNAHDQNALREAKLLASYLLRATASNQELRLYLKASRRVLLKEDRVVLAVRNRPRLLGLLDAATAFWAPKSPLRQRLIVMSAILETSPGRAGRYLPEHQNVIMIVLTLAFFGTAALVKLAMGTVLLLALQPTDVFRGRRA